MLIKNLIKEISLGQKFYEKVITCKNITGLKAVPVEYY